MTDPENTPVDTTPVDTTALDPREASKGTGADTAQSAGERDEAIREFDGHAEADAPSTLDRSEAVVDDGKDLPTPDPRDVTAGDKETSRQE